jgi:Tol biopolymer transport system component
MVVDGQPGQDFWAVSEGVFSPDGRKLAYVAARRSSNVSLVILEIGKGERVLEREFEEISSWSGDDGAGPPSLLWSPTSASVAFVGRRGTETVVEVDDATRGSHEEVTELAWSADGKSFAYVARHGGEWFVVRDGKKGEIFDRVLHLSFAPDGVPAYMAKEDQFLLIWGTRRGPRFAQAGRPAFSADGQKVAYSVGGRMVLNGGAGGQVYNLASDPVFSPDGRRLAYRAKLGEEERIVIRDGGEEKMEASFNRVDVPRFSPSGDVVAYRAWRGDKQVMVVGPRVGEKFSRVGDPVFSPDGRVVAYAGARYGKEVVVVGERLSEEVDQVLWGPVFSADGKKVSYRARIGAELWSKVLDVP